MHPLPVAAPEGFDRWAEFLLLVVVLLAFDLLVVHRKARVIPLREAAWWTLFWIGLALLFNAWVWWEYAEKGGPEAGREAATQFFTAYVLEKALSIDNLFVFLTIFAFFQVPGALRHRVLFLGILGALVMRGLFIWLGTEALHRVEASYYVFGGILLLTAVKLLGGGDSEFVPEKSLVYRTVRRLVPMVPEYADGRLTVVKDGKRYGTMLLMVLLVVEGSDVVFAVDSVPAVLAVSKDPFLVYTSNVFAILGLRALFFLLEGVLESLPGLQVGLGLVLAFVGAKMIGEPSGIRVRPLASLGIIAALLLGSWAVARFLKGREDAGRG